MDAAVKAVVKAIPAGDWQAHEDGLIAETVHCMGKTNRAFRLVVIRRPVQLNLLTGAQEKAERYTLIASNRTESAKETVDWYRQRGEASENRIKELKVGFGMERLPCGDFGANAVFFRIGALAYNLFVLFKRLALSETWRKHQGPATVEGGGLCKNRKIGRKRWVRDRKKRVKRSRRPFRTLRCRKTAPRPKETPQARTPSRILGNIQDVDLYPLKRSGWCTAGHRPTVRRRY